MNQARPPGWLPEEEFHAIYRRVPRLCVEVMMLDAEQRVLLMLRDIPPNIGAWHIPGGTVLFGESLADAVRRVAQDELGLSVVPGELLGYIEYPSHYRSGLDSPVGLAFRVEPDGIPASEVKLPAGGQWFGRLPRGLYAEQREFLTQRLGFDSD
ncbi:MAG TPA: NUDIX domain-containing protein [Solirubrobacteraceae bacterium]|nr:NUDIX domain-containing protein [Solirubrobacteraceae bacterium]